MEREANGYIKVNRVNMEQLCDVFARLYREGVRPCGIEIVDYSEYVKVQIPSNTTAKHQMATIARLMGKARKEHGENFYLYGEINGVPVMAFTGRDAVCRVTGYEEVVQPATPERTIKRAIWQCDEPLLAEESEVA